MKKLLVAAMLATVSTIGYAEDAKPATGETSPEVERVNRGNELLEKQIAQLKKTFEDSKALGDAVKKQRDLQKQLEELQRQVANSPPSTGGLSATGQGWNGQPSAGPSSFIPGQFGPAPAGPSPYIPGPFGPAPVGPSPLVPGQFGPAPFGPAPFGPAPFGPAPFGPSPFGPPAFAPVPFNSGYNHGPGLHGGMGPMHPGVAPHPMHRSGPPMMMNAVW